MVIRIKELEHQGYEFESADGSLALVIRKTMADAAPPFVVDTYTISVHRDSATSTCEAIVKIRVGDQSELEVRAVLGGEQALEHGVATGDEVAGVGAQGADPRGEPALGRQHAREQAGGHAGGQQLKDGVEAAEGRERRGVGHLSG